MSGSVLKGVYDRLPIPAQELLVAVRGRKSHRQRFGAPFRRALADYAARDSAGEDAIREDQDRRLREMVGWATRTVPYYRELFRREGIEPSSIRGVSDLPRIPYLDKQTVRLRARDLLSEAVPRRAIIPGHSSGTTGTALTLFHSREAMGAEYATIWRQRAWFGFELGERFAAFGGQTVVPLAQTAPPFWRYDRARNRVLFSLHHLAPRFLGGYAQELQRPGYRFWQGYPSSISLVAQYLLDEGIELGSAAPAAVFTSSETLLDFHREQIERASGAPVIDRYGNSEFSVSAVQCPAGHYHVDTEFCVLEIDPQEPAGNGRRGEVVSTGFANPAMPFLRYRTGDVATLQDGTDCPCGRRRPLLSRIDGRIEDYIVTPDGRRVGRMDHVFKDALQIKEAQIIQPAVDRIRVLLVPWPGFDQSTRSQLEREFRKHLGTQIAIDYELVAQIPRLANGKFRAVVSEIDGAGTGGAPTS